jgi:hypothetical protein
MASVLALEPLINGVLGLASAVGLLAALLLIQEPSPSSVTLAPPVGADPHSSGLRRSPEFPGIS